MGMNVEQYVSPRKEWISLRQIGQGWNAFDDPQDIKDQEIADVQNITFDKGYPAPRKGSTLKWEAPVGETNDLLALFAARTSDGTNYVIACYAPNFYFRDETNDQWVKINSTYTPSATYKGLMYGYTNWNAGIGSDVLYAGNGTEDSIKWQICSAYVATAISGSVTSLVLDDSTKFPATGSIVIQNSGGTPYYTTYSANSSNTLTIPTYAGPVSQGAVVTSQIEDATTVAKGKIFTKYLGRLIVANQKEGECSLFGSDVGDPETFTPNTNADKAFFEVITDGVGGITGVDSFGEYLIVEKDDSMHKVLLTTAQDSDGASYKRIDVFPVASDVSMGPVQPWSIIKKNNLLYFATATEGVFQVDPQITGSQMSVDIQVLSQIIKPYIETIDFTNTRTTSFNQKLLWSITSNSVGDGVLVYDLLRKTWTKFTNWNVKDWLVHNKKLHYGSRVDNNIYETFMDAKVDGETPFEAYLTTKKFDFGKGCLPKTTSCVFAAGYISPQEVLFFDVILTTGDKVVTIPYSLSGNGDFVVVQIPQALAMLMLGGWNLGEASLDSTTGLFKVYFSIPSRYGFFTMQIKVHSKVNGTDWGLTGLGFAPWLEIKHPANMNIGAIGDSTNNSITTTQSGQNNQFVLGGETFITTE